MQRPGLLGRPGGRGPHLRRARPRPAQAEDLRASSSPRSATSASWPRWPPRTRRWRPSSATQLASIERRLAELEEARLFSGEYDAGDAVVTVHAGRRRDRLPGLGGDPPAHVPALGRAARLRGRDEGGLGRGGGGPEVGDLHRPGRERLRPVRRRAGRPPAGPHLALRLLRAPPHQLRPGRRRPARRRGRRGRDRRRRPARRHLPRLGRRRPARQQDRLGGAHHPHPDRASSSSARTSAPRPRTRRSRCSSCARS